MSLHEALTKGGMPMWAYNTWESLYYATAATAWALLFFAAFTLIRWRTGRETNYCSTVANIIILLFGVSILCWALLTFLKSGPLENNIFCFTPTKWKVKLNTVCTDKRPLTLMFATVIKSYSFMVGVAGICTITKKLRVLATMLVFLAMLLFTGAFVISSQGFLPVSFLSDGGIVPLGAAVRQAFLNFYTMGIAFFIFLFFIIIRFFLTVSLIKSRTK